MSRPDRLRKACNECSAAKVKCTGERNGCRRCIELGHLCLYELSRTGKVPGMRAKKNNSRNRRDSVEGFFRDSSFPSATPDPGRRNQVINQSAAAFGRTTSRDTNSDQEGGLTSDPMPFAFDDRLYPVVNMGLSQQQQHQYQHQQQQHHKSNAQARNQSRSSISLSATDYDSSDVVVDTFSNTMVDHTQTPLTFDMLGSTWPSPDPSVLLPNDRTYPSTLSAQSPSQQQQQQQRLVETQKEMDQKRNSECVLACVPLVSRLETFIAARVQVLQLALDATKSALATLDAVTQRAPTSKRCHLLLIACVDQVVQVFETNCDGLLGKKNSNQSSAQQGDPLGSQPPCRSPDDSMTASALVSYGGVGLDIDDRQAIQIWAVRRELNKVQQTWLNVRRLLQLHPSVKSRGADAASSGVANVDGRPGGGETATSGSPAPDQGALGQEHKRMAGYSPSDPVGPEREDCVSRITIRLAGMSARIDRAQNML